MKLKTVRLEDVRPYENNPRRNDGAVDAVAESIRQCGYVAPIVVDEEMVILAGHTRYKALTRLGHTTAKVLIAEGLSEEQKRKYRILDNKTGEIAEWDEDLLNIELEGLDFDGFDFGLLDALPEAEPPESPTEQPEPEMRDPERAEDAPAEAKTQSAAEAMAEEAAREAAAAEGLEEDTPEYQAFVEKFKPKKTTDDCYTPDGVYDAVAAFVAEAYGVSRERFVRPFYPGGDYTAFAYAPDAVVVDNPPFSILAEILTFYASRGIRFFLFAPTLTLFSSSSASCAALPCGVAVTYENGANVSTSFLTNLEPEDVRVRLRPELYQAVKTANDANLAAQRKELPKYVYPDEVLTAAAAARLCKYGQALTLRIDETAHTRQLDAQRESGAAIFGSGYLLGSRAAAERAAAERAAANHWQLSERERGIIAALDAAEVKHGV